MHKADMQKPHDGVDRTFPGQLRLQYAPGERIMKAIEQLAGMDPEGKAELQAVCDRLASGASTSAEERRRPMRPENGVP